ncbi:MAG: transcription-repair coupling factor, partial [Gammaproteobacteria bacterium]|nr:transcription-repair coupling factor [Gammaproteobacteria bacterium]
MSEMFSVFNPLLPDKQTGTLCFGNLYGSSDALLINNIAEKHTGLTVVVTKSTNEALRLETAFRFFQTAKQETRILSFPDWETLPYDVFSPHQDIISQRISTLYHLPDTRKGILIIPVNMLMQKLAPRQFLSANSLLLSVGDTINTSLFRQQLEASSYVCVSQVMEHGEFA